VSARGAACLSSFAATSLWPLTNCKKLRAGYFSEGPLIICSFVRLFARSFVRSLACSLVLRSLVRSSAGGPGTPSVARASVRAPAVSVVHRPARSPPLCTELPQERVRMAIPLLGVRQPCAPAMSVRMPAVSAHAPAVRAICPSSNKAHCACLMHGAATRARPLMRASSVCARACRLPVVPRSCHESE
jgi:hypothetical protein